MSYDLSLTCDHCNMTRYPEYDSPTYNYGEMIRKCDELAGGEGCSFAAIEGKTGKEARAWFQAILDVAVDRRDAVKLLEPANGWGDYEGLLKIFRSYVTLCDEHPGATWHQCGDGGDRMRCCAGWECGEERDDDED